jgi:hypothetical protein
MSPYLERKVFNNVSETRRRLKARAGFRDDSDGRNGLAAVDGSDLEAWGIDDCS